MITLRGDVDPQHRLTFLLSLRDHAAQKINHFDGIRDRAVGLALALFAAASGFALRAPSRTVAIVTASSLVLLMAIFFVSDRALHRYSHGWQSTRRILTGKIAEVLNDPSAEISFPRYDHAAAKVGIRGLRSARHLSWIGYRFEICRA
ncbi:MAG: hypothetical protein MI919_00480 [Holophagales bacterium]|nr:hypothetical protein [Holophagales bacterium]